LTNRGFTLETGMLNVRVVNLSKLRQLTKENDDDSSNSPYIRSSRL
jgi:hypothetical protein